MGAKPQAARARRAVAAAAVRQQDERIRIPDYP
jgi:hypothetical protein